MRSSAKKIVWVNTISLIIMLFSNFLAGSGTWINKTVGEVSNKYDTLFTPAGYAFIIWSLIFLMLTCFCIYQWYLLQNSDRENWIFRVGYWFTLSNLLNVLWLFCWIREWIGLSVIVILLLLICLCVLTVRLRLELDDEPLQVILFIWWPVTVYLGWIIVATIACVAAWLVALGYHGGLLSAENLTIIMITIASGFFLFLLKIRNLREALLVGIWAFIAIAVKQWHYHFILSITALIESFVLLSASSIHLYKNSFTNPFAKLRRGEW